MTIENIKMQMIIITKIEKDLELKILLKQLFIDIQQKNFKKIIGKTNLLNINNELIIINKNL